MALLELEHQERRQVPALDRTAIQCLRAALALDPSLAPRVRRVVLRAVLFARALLRALGVGERIKSPTYSLIETYRVPAVAPLERAIHHLDLYRIADPGELEWLGLPDLCGEASLLVVEWPERGGDALPGADLLVDLAYAERGRRAVLRALTPRGADWLAPLGPG